MSNALTANATTFAQAIVAATGAQDGVDEIDFPARVKMVYIDFTAVFETGPATIPEVVVAIIKIPGNTFAPPTPAQMLALGNYAGVSNIFFVAQGAPGQYGVDNNSFRLRGWIRIPPRFQVFNEQDRLFLCLANNTAITMTVCTLAIYKWRQ